MIPWQNVVSQLKVNIIRQKLNSGCLSYIKVLTLTFDCYISVLFV